MPKSKPLVDGTGEVRDLTIGDLRGFKPVQALPGSLRRKLGARGPQKAPTKERITIRLSRHVVESFRATGDGWQTRVDAALQDWLDRHEPAGR
ncbi:MAG: BrnA antitoxin family protein [Burkholderiales bacterium]|nr:BrnA antitoxin family protein [Burkholderiales bacterium]MDE2565850.1 BrnA antitoxin family protein [Burkholderiales bacterium]